MKGSVLDSKRRGQLREESLCRERQYGNLCKGILAGKVYLVVKDHDRKSDVL